MAIKKAPKEDAAEAKKKLAAVHALKSKAVLPAATVNGMSPLSAKAVAAPQAGPINQSDEEQRKALLAGLYPSASRG
jgi:hypothetical protein